MVRRTRGITGTYIRYVHAPTSSLISTIITITINTTKLPFLISFIISNGQPPSPITPPHRSPSTIYLLHHNQSHSTKHQRDNHPNSNPLHSRFLPPPPRHQFRFRSGRDQPSASTTPGQRTGFRDEECGDDSACVLNHPLLFPTFPLSPSLCRLSALRRSLLSPLELTSFARRRTLG